MARYFVNLRLGGDFISDDEGVDHATDEEARHSVLSAIKQMIARDVKDGISLSVALNGVVELKDQAGRPVLFMPFIEVVESDIQGETLDLIATVEQRAHRFG